jgi:lambda family phage portal protein
MIDRFLIAFFPRVAAKRFSDMAAMSIARRHFEATSPGRRTEGWFKSGTGANAANQANLAPLRNISRDLYRNNGWARRGTQAICNNTVGWGITPRTKSKPHADLWKRWAGSTDCDRRGRLTFYGIQYLALKTVVISGEALIVRYDQPGRHLPFRMAVLEPDYIDTTKTGTLSSGGRIVQGVEFDKNDRRVAYYIHEKHPGEVSFSRKVNRVPAEDVVHLFEENRPEQVRGISWLCAAILKLQDFDDYEDALLMRQKIAACYAGFITNVDGDSQSAGINEDIEDGFDSIEPGMLHRLRDGEGIEFGSPPPVTDNDQFSRSTLRRIAASMGVSYEDLTGDYSQVTFSSARMGRLAHYGNVHQWRWNMMIPQLCARVWEWFEDAAELARGIPKSQEDVSWTPPPMPMIEPDREGKAYMMNVRSGMMTHSEMIAEQGGDPLTHWDEYAEGLKALDDRKIILDSDPRKTSAAGLSQEANAKKGAEASQ